MTRAFFAEMIMFGPVVYQVHYYKKRRELDSYLSLSFFPLISIFCFSFLLFSYFFLLGFLLNYFGKNAEKRQNGLQATVENVVVMATSLVNAKSGEFIKSLFRT